jgi:hypothetical protein
LWYFRGADTTAILYHVHHNRTGFLHLCLRFWWALRHLVLPAKSGLTARSRTARGNDSPRTLDPHPQTRDCGEAIERVFVSRR